MDSHYGVGNPVWNQTAQRGFDAGINLKSTTGWDNNGNGTNSSGFTSLPGGYRGNVGDFSNFAITGVWLYIS